MTNDTERMFSRQSVEGRSRRRDGLIPDSKKGLHIRGVAVGGDSGMQIARYPQEPLYAVPLGTLLFYPTALVWEKAARWEWALQDALPRNGSSLRNL